MDEAELTQTVRSKLKNWEANVMSKTKSLGDLVERVGVKIQVLGETIYKIGNVIEHMNERDSPFQQSPGNPEATEQDKGPQNLGESTAKSAIAPDLH